MALQASICDKLQSMQGILGPYDAVRALEAKVDGIILSNHGGRQLDYAPTVSSPSQHKHTEHSCPATSRSTRKMAFLVRQCQLDYAPTVSAPRKHWHTEHSCPAT